MNELLKYSIKTLFMLDGGQPKGKIEMKLIQNCNIEVFYHNLIYVGWGLGFKKIEMKLMHK